MPIGGPSGPGSLVGVTILPGENPAAGSIATVGLLTGDGSVAQLSLPTTGQGVQQGLAPVGSLATTLLGEPVGGSVVQLTNGLAPSLAPVTSAVDQLATPLLGTVNGALAPVTAPLVGGNGPLAPVTGLAETALGGLTGVVGSGTAGVPGGSLLGADVGGNALTGASTPDTLVGVNLLPPDGGSAAGQLATVGVLSQGNLVDVALPTTAAGVESGLQPVSNLAGALVGGQAGAVANQLTEAVAPVAATATSAVDGIAAPLLDNANALAPALPGASGVLNPAPAAGDVLAPVTGLVNGIVAPATGSAGTAAPVTGLLGGLLGGN